VVSKVDKERDKLSDSLNDLAYKVKDAMGEAVREA